MTPPSQCILSKNKGRARGKRKKGLSEWRPRTADSWSEGSKGGGGKESVGKRESERGGEKKPSVHE